MTGAAASLDDGDREAVETLLRRLADDELVLAERYTEWQVRAPTLESDLALSNVAQDEFGHARLWYDLLKEFGHDEPALIWERDPADFRHATLVERPFETGDWADCVVRNYLYDAAEALRVDALRDSAFDPIADRAGKVESEEAYHREHGRRWLERLVDDERDRVQAAVDRRYPDALALFEPVDPAVEARIDDAGFRTRSLDDMRDEWLATTGDALDSLGLDVPADPSPPDAVGRDGTHTDAWRDLHAEMTRTYRDLDRHDTVEIRGEAG